MTLHDLILVIRSRWRVVTIATLLALFVVAVVNLGTIALVFGPTMLAASVG